MEKYKLDFESLPWETPVPGLRVKTINDGNKQIRLAEFSSVFEESKWCEKGHVGIVIQGELEIDFHGTLIQYSMGNAISIPRGVDHRHKARSITPTTTLFLVEEISDGTD